MHELFRVPLAIAVPVLGLCGYLVWWLGWNWGYVRGRQEGWASCKQFLAKYPDGNYRPGGGT